MNDAKIGERYFAIRDRIYHLISQIHTLAHDCHTPIDELLSQEQAALELDAPLRILVCGEINSGKSSLINALCGEDLCPVLQLPNTDKIYDYQYFPVVRTMNEDTPHQICQSPSQILKRLNPIDTPGTNSANRDHIPHILELANTVDLILMVFPIANPWGASAWNLLADLPAEAREKLACVIILSETSLAQDSEVILNHLQDLAQKRIGSIPPFFSISPKKAADAQRPAKVNQSLLKESGIPALMDFITLNVCSSIERRKIMRQWCAQANSALRSIEDRLESRARKLKHQKQFMQGVQQEIYQIGDRFIQTLPNHLEDVAEIFQKEALTVSKSLNRRLGVIQSFYRVMMGDRTSHHMEELFISRLEKAVLKVAERDSKDITQSCLDHWNNLNHRVQDALDLSIQDPAHAEIHLADSRQHFINHLGQGASLSLNQLSIRNTLTKNLYLRNRSLKCYLVIALALFTTASTCGILDLPLVPYVILILAVLFLFAGTVVSMMTKKNIVLDFKQRLLDTCDAFAATLRMDYEDGMQSMLRDYTSCMLEFHKHLAVEEQSIEPRKQEWKDLFLTLKTIEQDL